MWMAFVGMGAFFALFAWFFESKSKFADKFRMVILICCFILTILFIISHIWASIIAFMKTIL